jgi:hypothetical protein
MLGSQPGRRDAELTQMSEYDETKRISGRGMQPPPPPRRPSNVPYINVARLWSGGVATAVVAALIGVVGVLIVRAVFQVAIGGAKSAGPLGDESTVWLCLSGALAALIATGLAHLLLLGTPRPLAYLGWIVGLLTAIATVLPLLGGISVTTVSTAVIHLIMGLVIGSLVTGAAASAGKRPRPAYDEGWTQDTPRYDPRYDR